MTPIEYCRDKASASGSSFYYSFIFLPPEKRNAITAFYAFCREVDDVVDESSDTALAKIKLQWWKSEIDRVYAGNPTHPIGQALLQYVLPAGIREPQLLQVLAGMEMDLSQQRYADLPSLMVYCHRVAGVVGEVSSSLFGARHENTLSYGNKLGLALQLTNIIRDIGEDARRGRVYLPEDMLVEAQINHQDLLDLKDSPALRNLLNNLAQKAYVLYKEAMGLLNTEEVRQQRAGLIMARIYRALLDEIAATDYAVLHQRITLPATRKLWLAWKTWVSPQAAIRTLSNIPTQ
ncbi:MAG: presqualene diphosphate synthase HpnD [Burkholderiaceae bacterium]|nr:presqualene diphosphate synthase HpnD [Burkholderiaceae bacterium]